MSVTTVKLYEETKFGLDEIRLENESYDDIISRLLMKFNRSVLKNKLREGYIRNSKEDTRLVNEWEISSSELI